MELNDIQSVLLNRVLVRLYDDVATINTQIRAVNSDVAYLVQTGQISPEDAAFILEKVPATTDPSVSLARQPLSISSDTPSPPSHHNQFINNNHSTIPNKYFEPTSAAIQPRRPVPKVPVVNTFQARALWDYNIDNEHADDLTFWSGDTIEVDESSTEKNEDWWTGKVRGQSGLFPSSYVERITHSLPPPPAPMIMKSSRPGSEVGVGTLSGSRSVPTYTPYHSTHVAMNPSGGGPNMLGLQPQQQQETDEAKRGKYDHLKSTMATSAAGGVGFGAGAALAGGLVRAIF